MSVGAYVCTLRILLPVAEINFWCRLILTLEVAMCLYFKDNLPIKPPFTVHNDGVCLYFKDNLPIKPPFPVHNDGACLYFKDNLPIKPPFTVHNDGVCLYFKDNLAH